MVVTGPNGPSEVAIGMTDGTGPPMAARSTVSLQPA
jgi:hypothetical protein